MLQILWNIFGLVFSKIFSSNYSFKWFQAFCSINWIAL